MSPHSSSSDRHWPAAAKLRTWSGPALAAFGAIAVAAIALSPSTSQSTLAWWILNSALAPVRVLPLLGLGVLLALAERWRIFAALLIFGVSITAGFLAQDRFVSVMAAMQQAASHEFLTGPISCLAVGLALVPSARLRPWLLPFASAIAGAMLALAIEVTDPGLHDPTIPLAGVLIALWIVAGVSLTLRAFRREWFVVAGRILGSWLIAIGLLLYGGASLGPKRGLPVPPTTGPSKRLDMMPLPRIGRTFPGGDRPDDQMGPGGESDVRRSPQ